MKLVVQIMVGSYCGTKQPPAMLPSEILGIEYTHGVPCKLKK